MRGACNVTSMIDRSSAIAACPSSDAETSVLPHSTAHSRNGLLLLAPAAQPRHFVHGFGIPLARRGVAREL
jgi:hypothetical protein